MEIDAHEREQSKRVSIKYVIAVIVFGAALVYAYFKWTSQAQQLSPQVQARLRRCEGTNDPLRCKLQVHHGYLGKDEL